MDLGNNDSKKTSDTPTKLNPEVIVKIEVPDNFFSPLVYTTRLDQMDVFKTNLRNMKAQNIYESATRESKPEYSLKRKMRSLGDSGITYEKLAEKINALNAKEARKAAKFKERGISLTEYEPATVGIRNKRNESYVEDTESYKPASEDNLKDMDIEDPLKNPSPLSKPNGLLIYDKQQNEADLYYFDEKHCITEYKKIKIGKLNDHMTPSVTNDPLIETVYCCCWFERQRILNVSPFPQEIVRFLRKPHRCRKNLCSCCCNKNKTESVPQPIITVLEKPSPSTWFKSLTDHYQSQKKAQSIKLLAKCLSLPPIASKPRNSNHTKENRTFLNSINLQFQNECYQIGLGGRMELLFRKINESEIENVNLATIMSKTNAVNVCCWHKREQYAHILFKDGVPDNSVNFFRNSHRCPVNTCSCCCKQINMEQSKLALLSITARHSNEIAYNKLNVNNKVSPFSIEKFDTHQFNHSFYLPLENYIIALEYSDNERLKLHDPEKVKKILTTFSKVKFTVKGTLLKHSVVADVNLLALSKTELSILKTTLSIIKSSILSKKRNFTSIIDKKLKESSFLKPLPKATVNKKGSTEISLLLSQLSHIADIKNKRYIPSFRGYTSMNFPELEISQKVFKPVPNTL